MNDWHNLKSELFKKQPYHHPGCGNGSSRSDVSLYMIIGNFGKIHNVWLRS
jgi:hypothetical protein